MPFHLAEHISLMLMKSARECVDQAVSYHEVDVEQDVSVKGLNEGVRSQPQVDHDQQIVDEIVPLRILKSRQQSLKCDCYYPAIGSLERITYCGRILNNKDRNNYGCNVS